MIEEPISEEEVQEEEIKEVLPEGHGPKGRRWIAAAGCFAAACAVFFMVTLILAGTQTVRRFMPAMIPTMSITPLPAVQANGLGDPKAPVHVIEYGDYQCPYCLEFWQESEAQLITEYVDTGRVYFEYRSVGAYIGPESGWAAEGSYCAGDQGRFWQYHNTLFANWTGENVGDFTQEKLGQYAQALDLNMAQFEACMKTEKYKAAVEEDAVRSRADGVHGTPTLFINGVKYEGTQPFHALKFLIDQALNGNIEKESG